MANKKKVELTDELDSDLNFEGEGLDGKCAAKYLVSWAWAVGALVVIVFVFALISGKGPSARRVKESWGEPEKTAKLFAPSGQSAAWQDQRCPVTGQAAAWQGQSHPALIKQFGIEVSETPSGVAVSNVYVGSWAEKGGLKRGDILQNVNRAKVGSISELRAAVNAAPPEKRVPVRVLRAGNRRTLNIMVGEGELEGVTLPGQTPPPAPPGAAAAWSCPNIGTPAAQTVYPCPVHGDNCPAFNTGGRAAATPGAGHICPNCNYRNPNQAQGQFCPQCGFHHGGQGTGGTRRW